MMMITQAKSAISQNQARLSAHEFNALVKLVYSECGINLGSSKKVMLESRLAKRLRLTNMASFKEYVDYVHTKEGRQAELIHMLDVVATNKTDFFREPHHFEYLRNALLPEHLKKFGSRTFKIWSAACSSGEEPYTIAMVLSDFKRHHPSFRCSIVASDISTQVLEKAVTAIYSPDRISSLPLAIKQQYFLRSKNLEKPVVRVSAEIRNMVQFSRVNLIEDDQTIEKGLDAIFCRNVLIYFDRETQQQVVSKLISKLSPRGFLFIGHSESLHQFDLPLTQLKPTVFIKD